MFEIGGDYSFNSDGLSEKANNLKSYLNNERTSFFDYGRSAVRSIPYDKKRKVLLPEYICESVIGCYNESETEFYKINEDTSIDCENLINKLNRNVGVLFIAHYYGAIQNKEVLTSIIGKAHDLGVVVIEDVTQSIFSESDHLGDYVVGSIRKWMMVPQGSFLIDNIGNVDTSKYEISSDNSRLDAMKLKDRYLKTGDDVKSEYRQLFAQCEDTTDKLTVPRLMSEEAEKIMDLIDVAEIIRRRKDNYDYLLSELAKLGIEPIVKLKSGDCPLTLPIRVKNGRDDFRKYLTENNIFCPVHWPLDQFMTNSRPMAIYNANTVISLVIDQRYSRADMDKMIEVIAKYKGEPIC